MRGHFASSRVASSPSPRRGLVRVLEGIPPMRSRAGGGGSPCTGVPLGDRALGARLLSQIVRLSPLAYTNQTASFRSQRADWCVPGVVPVWSRRALQRVSPHG
jgi:hypothetical protein